MSGITQEQIEQARQIGILAYMQTYEPQELVKVGQHEYKTRTHDSLRISENGKWNWCSQGFGGTNALNYLVHVKGLDFVSAVQQLCGIMPVSAIAARSTYEKALKDQPPPTPFSAPPRDADNTAALRYLRGRGIRDPVLNYCIEQGTLYQADRKGYKNCVFLGRDGAGKPQYACVRGCGGDFRGDVAGSQKRFGFCIPARDPDAARVVLVDGGSGAAANSRGTTCFCVNLYTGEQEKWRRYDVLGEVKPECLPDWAVVRAAEIGQQRAEQKRSRKQPAQER